MELLSNSGRKIPEDLSVIGFDNIGYSQFVNPKLTTIAQDIYKMGNLSCGLLLESINGNIINKFSKEDKILNPKLIIRNSCIPR